MVGCCCHIRQRAPGRTQLRPSPAGCRRRTSVPALALFPRAGGRGVQRPVRPAVDRRKPGCDPPLRPAPPTAGRRAPGQRRACRGAPGRGNADASGHRPGAAGVGGPPGSGGGQMIMAPARQTGEGQQAHDNPGVPARRTGPGAYPWAMAAAIAAAACGAALSLNGVLRGWNWYWAAMTTVVAVAFTMAALRSVRAQPLLVTAGGFVALGGVLTLTFFRGSSFLWVVPTGATLPELDRLIQRASETVLAETAPVAPNAGIVVE